MAKKEVIRLDVITNFRTGSQQLDTFIKQLQGNISNINLGDIGNKLTKELDKISTKKVNLDKAFEMAKLPNDFIKLQKNADALQVDLQQVYKTLSKMGASNDVLKGLVEPSQAASKALQQAQANLAALQKQSAKSFISMPKGSQAELGKVKETYQTMAKQGVSKSEIAGYTKQQLAAAQERAQPQIEAAVKQRQLSLQKAGIRKNLRDDTIQTKYDEAVSSKGAASPEAKKWEAGIRAVERYRKAVKEARAEESTIKSWSTTATEKSGSIAEAKSQVISAQGVVDKETIAQVDALKKSLNTMEPSVEKINGSFSSIGQSLNEGLASSSAYQKAVSGIESVTSRMKYFLSATMIFSQIRQLIQGAYQDLKELDSLFNQISVVSGQTMDELWGGFSRINQTAQTYGVTAKDVVNVQNIYYHQGKSVAEVNKLTAETLTMAKIAGMDYADATDMMTAALNGFKLSADEASRVTDVFSALSAAAAVDTQEVATALSKTASIAGNAGMDIESTSVFLTKMIETTRESSENLGTAMKTVIARFAELKKAQKTTDEDGVTTSLNNVDEALKSVGIQLKTSAGEFRDTDDVLMELSSKWDSLDRNSQRYIATQAAGSRLNVNRLHLAA